ncbi:AAA family ATPase [Actinomadura barringtoniae]|uniref:AAA family ATPase n=1 Tax=Actinomadura barringtoniae TaxID=1427535 RepID=A0A939PLV3_9ACTN|nr:AAA family ATPase [Actinomadura barringtoniae]MBO2455186.1 AAA family ATPase [Actinomadura barringtoniae]
MSHANTGLPAGPDVSAAVSETHTGVVFFVGDRAYKLKKPVSLGFLDFGTREARERACHRELELNRRFSPDVYLDVADVHDSSGRPRDHLVVMRRMPSGRRLSTLVASQVAVDDALRAVARQLAAWHARAPRNAEISAEGTRDALLSRWAASFDQVRPFHDRPLSSTGAREIERLVRAFLAGREPLFDARIADGRVIDGHGDLMADDIFVLDDGPRVLDCLEFDDKLRYLDGLDDASFLAMDLERLAAPTLARRFIRWYSEYAADPAPLSLRHHYVAYRAFVRAKVACLRHGQGDPAASAEAAALADVALRHLRAGEVTLVLVGGLPGVGKSTLAGALAEQLGWALISSDRLRKESAGIPPEHAAAAPFGTGLYDQPSTSRTYATLLDHARRLLARGESVVLDASWTDRLHREAAEALATDLHATLVQLRCEAPADVAAQRLRTRPRGYSDADHAVAAAMAGRADAWPEASTIDTDRPVEESLDSAVALVRPHGHEHVWHSPVDPVYALP